MVKEIEYLVYEEMATKEISKIREEAFAKRPLSCLHIHHSLGRVEVGDISMFIFVSSGHRKEAIDALRELVEEVKYKVPIWKQEIMNDDSKRWVK